MLRLLLVKVLLWVLFQYVITYEYVIYRVTEEMWCIYIGSSLAHPISMPCLRSRKLSDSPQTTYKEVIEIRRIVHKRNPT